jgi:hypothetical protein
VAGEDEIGDLRQQRNRATPRDIRWLLVGDAVRVAAAGIAVGLAVAWPPLPSFETCSSESGQGSAHV